eukprot:Skav212103  [mRNA]  locus=scaffold686:94847:97138:- [translate_table: standard]
MGHNVSQTPTFYTDGSSIFPTLPGGCLAAFSIILDTARDDHERIAAVQRFRTSHVKPECLEPIQIALACGAQTINRAELSAMIQIVRSCDAAFIYSDSAWAIGVFEAVRDAPFPQAHMHRANFDMICDLIQLTAFKDLANFHLHKLRSHQCLHEIDDDMDLFHALGNDVADMAAKTGTDKRKSAVHQASWDIALWKQDQLRSELPEGCGPGLPNAAYPCQVPGQGSEDIAAALKDFEDQGLRDILVGPVPKDPVKAREMAW